MCLILLLTASGSAMAEVDGHSIPPHIGANASHHVNSGAVRVQGRDTRDHEASKRDRQSSGAQQRPAISPEQAAQRARNRFGGRVLNVVLEHGPGGPYYRVKLLEHGRVRVVDIDARR